MYYSKKTKNSICFFTEFEQNNRIVCFIRVWSDNQLFPEKFNISLSFYVSDFAMITAIPPTHNNETIYNRN